MTLKVKIAVARVTCIVKRVSCHSSSGPSSVIERSKLIVIRALHSLLCFSYRKYAHASIVARL